MSNTTRTEDRARRLDTITMLEHKILWLEQHIAMEKTELAQDKDRLARLKGGAP